MRDVTLETYNDKNLMLEARREIGKTVHSGFLSLDEKMTVNTKTN